MSDNAAVGLVDIMCLGAVMIDLIGVEPSASLAGVETFRRMVGGATQNVATTAVRLGLTTAIATCVGDDAFGQFLHDELRRRGIRDTFVQVDPARHTTLAFFARQGEERTFEVVRGADQYFVLDADLRSAIEQAAALHITTFSLAVEPSRTAAITAVEQAHAAGRIVSLDPNYRAGNWPEPSSFMPLLRHLLPMTTVIKPSLQDAEAIWGAGLSPGDYVERFHAAGAQQVLLTLGREGVLVSDEAMSVRLPAVPVDATDTHGVGDAFTAGALAALLDGQDLVMAAQVGALVASYVLRAPDSLDPLPRWAALLAQATTEPGMDTPDDTTVRRTK